MSTARRARRASPYLACGAILAAVLAAPRAAAGEARRVVLSYEVAAACPDATAFRGQVTTRTPLAEFAGSDGTPMRVKIWQQRGTFHGTLETSFDHTNRVRRLDDAVCADLVDALALSAALAIDPEAVIAPAAAPSALSLVASEESNVPLAAREPKPSIPSPPALAPPAPASVDHRPRPTDTTRGGVHWDGSAAVGFEVDTAIGASPLAGVVVRGPELRTARSLLFPAFRVSFGGMSSSLFPSASALAEFTLWRGRVWMSALGVEAGPFLFRPSVGFGLGWLSARGLAVFEPRTSGSLWGELAATVEATAFLGRYAFTSIHAGVLVPLTATTFVFDGPKRVIHQTESIGALAEIDLGVRFR